MRHPEEENWIDKAQTGDRAAFAELVRHYWGPVQRWLHGMTNHVQTAEDLAQEVFLKVWSGLKSYTRGTNFRAWVFCIARHCLIDSQRGQQAVPPRALPETLASEDRGPVSTLVQRETQTLIEQAIARLPVSFREPFLLRTQEELSYADISQVLALTEETVRWRVFKARQLLLSELGSVLDREES